ncbi:MAG: hypothetical protein GY947_08275 [Rhodobacteraceae bacterium]|nr:hypothetical protein [Paracoccaceae bacterium]
MIENYARIVNGGEAFLWELNPNRPEGQYCPEAADVVHDFLNSDTDQFSPVAQAGTLTFPIVFGGLAPTTATTLGHGLHNGQHYVIRGSRESYEDTHWFVVMKYQNTVYVVDAMTHRCTPDIAGYLSDMTLTNFRRVTGGYNCTPRDEMDMSIDIF